MRMLGTIDLEILQLAATHDKNINESELENSSLKRLGVGKILDSLASLRDRDLLVLNQENGSFTMTDSAYNILWSNKIPLVTRIFRLLEIKSCSTSEIIATLQTDQQQQQSSLELKETLARLQREQYVMITPQIRNGKLEKIYQILPKGLNKTDVNSHNKDLMSSEHIQIPKETPSPLNIIDEISRMISTSKSITTKEQRVISQKLSGLYDMLEKSTKHDHNIVKKQ